MPKRSTSWEPGDPLCPWWFGWWKGGVFPPRPPKGLEKEAQVLLTLAIRDLARQLTDKTASKQIAEIAKSSLETQVKSLGR